MNSVTSRCKLTHLCRPGVGRLLFLVRVLRNVQRHVRVMLRQAIHPFGDSVAVNRDDDDDDGNVWYKQRVCRQGCVSHKWVPESLTVEMHEVLYQHSCSQSCLASKGRKHAMRMNLSNSKCNGLCHLVPREEVQSVYIVHPNQLLA